MLELSRKDYEEEVVMSGLITCTTVTIRSTWVNFLKFLQSRAVKTKHVAHRVTWHSVSPVGGYQPAGGWRGVSRGSGPLIAVTTAGSQHLAAELVTESQLAATFNLVLVQQRSWSFLSTTTT